MIFIKKWCFFNDFYLNLSKIKAYGSLAGPNDSDEELQQEEGEEVIIFNLSFSGVYWRFSRKKVGRS